MFAIPRQAIPKGKIVTYAHFVVDIRLKKLKLAVSTSLWVAASSNIQGMRPHTQQASPLLSASETAPSPLKVQGKYV
jgi:hypothetical protein